MKRASPLKKLTGLAVVLALCGILLGGCENSLIYHPVKYPNGLWDTSKMPLPIEDVWFEAKDGVKLHGWYVPREKAVATLLFFQGNAGNITHRLENIFFLHHLDINVFIFGYRGFGRSEGDPDEQGIQLDAQAAYDEVMKKPGVSVESLFVFGRSLGGVFAAHTASKNPAAGLILESTFTNGEEIADHLFGILPLDWFLSSELDTLGAVAELKIPKLFMHGNRDQIIPYTMGRKLYQGAAEPKEFYTIAGAGHNNTFQVGGKAYFDTIKAFITRTLTGSYPEGEQADR